MRTKNRVRKDDVKRHERKPVHACDEEVQERMLDCLVQRSLFNKWSILSGGRERDRERRGKCKTRRGGYFEGSLLM